VPGCRIAREAAPPGTQNDVANAERAHYFDAGVNQVMLPGLKVGADAYFKIAQNLVDEGQFGAPILLTPFNYAKPDAPHKTRLFWRKPRKTTNNKASPPSEIPTLRKSAP